MGTGLSHSLNSRPSRGTGGAATGQFWTQAGLGLLIGCGAAALVGALVLGVPGGDPSGSAGEAAVQPRAVRVAPGVRRVPQLEAAAPAPTALAGPGPSRAERPQPNRSGPLPPRPKGPDPRVLIASRGGARSLDWRHSEPLVGDARAHDPASVPAGSELAEPDAGRIVGRLLDAAGQGWDGQQVVAVAYDPRQTSGVRHGFRARTRGGGRFELTLPAGTWRVEAPQLDVGSSWIPVAEQRESELTLHGPERAGDPRLRVRVFEPGGGPAALVQAIWVVQTAEGRRVQVQPAEAGRHSGWLWLALPPHLTPQALELWPGDRRYRAQLERLAPGTQRLQLTLVPAPRVELSLTLAPTIREASVKVRPADDVSRVVAQRTGLGLTHPGDDDPEHALWEGGGQLERLSAGRLRVRLTIGLDVDWAPGTPLLVEVEGQRARRAGQRPDATRAVEEASTSVGGALQLELD